MKLAAGLLVALVCSGALASDAGQRTLTFEDRVKAQEAIERVYYSHQIGTTKPFEQAVPRAVLEGKVHKYLEQTAALKVYWKTTVTNEMLQRELERMAHGTRMPERLRELYAALDNDSFVIKECLARATLVDRLAHEDFAFDSTLHAEARRRANEIRRQLFSAELDPATEHPYRTVSELVMSETAVENSNAGEQANLDVDGTKSFRQQLSPGEFWKQRAQLPTGQGHVSAVKEDRNAFVISVVLSETVRELKVASYVIPKSSWDEWWARTEKTLQGELVPSVARDRGQLISPTQNLSPVEDLNRGRDVGQSCPLDDTWISTSTDGAPTGRYWHTAIWTGSLMVVWGGLDPVISNGVNSGGRYDPATDTWTPTSITGAPSARFLHTAVWTGSRMIVWGGRGFDSADVGTGGRYDPATDTWTPTSMTGAPGAREAHAAVWTGTVMIVWGGGFTTGGRYDPATDTWTPTSMTGAPSARYSVSAVWTGSLMVVWGGESATGPEIDSGGRYNPVADTWQPTATAGAPSPRAEHTAVWTGSVMVVWGGVFLDQSVHYLNTGGRYDPATDSWAPTSLTGAPSERRLHTAVRAGRLMAIWGGQDLSFNVVNTGGRYDPTEDTWTPTSLIGAPSARGGHTAVWTGALIIDWGDSGGGNTGGRYFLSTSASCDDGNPCTDDFCDAVAGCLHTNNTVSCDDGDACTAGDTCGGGTCHPGSAVVCNDNNVCTSDTCDPAAGCVFTNNTNPCDDGNACATGDTCGGGTCHPGTPIVCNDDNECTTDSCNAATGCVFTNNTNGCNDNNPCTDDSCNPTTGCVYTNNTSACDDGSACTTGDTCGGGACVGGPALNCDDGIACTSDSCDPITGCRHLAHADCCATPPPVTCPNTTPCDVLPDVDHCPEGTPVSESSVLVEPETAVICAGDSLLVAVTRNGELTRTETSTDTVCDEACFDGCFNTCVRMTLQRCYNICVRRCTNGVCLDWESVCETQTLVTDCDVSCFDQCEQNFNPVTHTSTYTQACGQPIAETLELRQGTDSCTGALVETYFLSGVGTAGIGLNAPLIPGTYVLCLGGEVIKSFEIQSCGSRCRVRLQSNEWLLTAGLNGTFVVEVESAAAGGTYSVSLNRFEDNAHTVPLPVPGFLSGPAAVAVPDVGAASFPLTATNPQPVDGQTHWSNVIVRVEGPAICEAPFDVTIAFPAAQCAGQPAGTSCGDPSESACDDADTCDGAGNCLTNHAPDGTSCSDNNACTQTDSCQAGVCTPGNPVLCTASDQCHVAGTCEPATGFCSNPAKTDGTACNDSDACTQTDTCQSGTCSGSNPVLCTATDQCHVAGVCNPITGRCSNPAAADGAACNDGNACTTIDTCNATGACVGGGPALNCDDGDACTTDTCDPNANSGAGGCVFTPVPNCSHCSFSSATGQPERCFGGVGVRCEGIAVVAPFTKHDDTCLVDGWMSIGSILHDRCCLATGNAGYSCAALNQGDKRLCKKEWDEAWSNTQCTALGPALAAPRQWQRVFGPYPAGNTGDDVTQDLRAPAGANVNPKYESLCASGRCERNSKGHTIVYFDNCGKYCRCQ
jgi:hypothetical protein